MTEIGIGENIQTPSFDPTQILSEVNNSQEDQNFQQEDTNVNNEVSPLNDTFSQNITANQPNNLLAAVSPAKFDGLLKVLSLVAESNDPIVVKNSQITKSLTSGALVYANVKDIFDNQNVNIHIVNPRKSLKLLRAFKSNNTINILNDDENCRYILTNGEVRLFLPKQDDTTLGTTDELPNYSQTVEIAKITLDKEAKNIISELAKECDYIEYLFQDNQLKGLHIPETAIYIFESFVNDEKVSNLDETNAELSLQTTSFAPVSAESYEIQIGKSETEYFSFTTCKTGLVDVNIFEQLENTTGGSIF